MNILAIDCCPRGGISATRRLLERCLSALYQDHAICRLNLYNEQLAPLRGEDIQRRMTLADSGAFDDALFQYAKQFRDADEIVIAAPYWDLSFPSMLKVYLEHVSVSGVTFAYGADGRPVGYCRAKRILYLSTCGGYVQGPHMGADYVRALGRMLGIPDTRAYSIQGLDIDPARREALIQDGIERVVRDIRADA